MYTQEPTFTEKQRFRQWWLWILLSLGQGFFLWMLIQQIGLGIPFGSNPAPDFLIIFLGLTFGCGPAIFMYLTGLDTIVTVQGILLRFHPFHRRWVTFAFKSVAEARAITYNPIRDYGGWGIRYGRKGKAYNVSGNQGVLLTLKDGRTVLIGSRNHTLLLSRIEAHLD